MIKKHITDFRLISIDKLSSKVFLMNLTPVDGSPIAETKPGQFVEVRVEQVLLRRPISIHQVDKESNTLRLLVQNVGKGTFALSHLSSNDIVNIVYPLGNGFTLPSQNESSRHYLLIGGGVGIAPLLQTGIVLHAAGHRVTFLLGGRTISDIVRVEEFKRYGNLCITSEDGSTIPGADCQRGFVTQHTAFASNTYDAIRVCGPLPMMKAVKRVVASWNVTQPHYCEVSLENKMACGIGVCLCCVEKTQEGNKCVCTEGPVFDVNDLTW